VTQTEKLGWRIKTIGVIPEKEYPYHCRPYIDLVERPVHGLI